MIWFILLMVGMAAAEAPKLYTQKKRKELTAFCGAWVLATTYGILAIAKVDVPKPTDIIESILGRIF